MQVRPYGMHDGGGVHIHTHLYIYIHMQVRPYGMHDGGGEGCFGFEGRLGVNWLAKSVNEGIVRPAMKAFYKSSTTRSERYPTDVCMCIACSV